VRVDDQQSSQSARLVDADSEVYRLTWIYGAAGMAFGLLGAGLFIYAMYEITTGNTVYSRYENGVFSQPASTTALAQMAFSGIVGIGLGSLSVAAYLRMRLIVSANGIRKVGLSGATVFDSRWDEIDSVKKSGGNYWTDPPRWFVESKGRRLIIDKDWSRYRTLAESIFVHVPQLRP